MRIAVVQAELPIQSYTRDLVNGLRAQGFELELVTLSEDWLGFVEPASVRAVVYQIEPERFPRILRDVQRSVASVLGRRISICSAHRHRQAQRFLGGAAPFDLVVGIEKAGLELAARFAERARIPLVYYSLELYLEDHPDFPKFAWKRGSEIESHQRAVGTIIQDRSRWEVLKAANRPGCEEVFFLPVGVPEHEKQRAQPPTACEVAPHEVLYMGLIAERRFADELLEAAPTLPEGVRLHLHGPLSATFERSLPERVLPPNAVVTSNMLDEPALEMLVAGAAIGLALYRRDYANDRITAFSSQKLAMYLRAGVPIITFESESYVELFSRFPCGEMVDDFSELPAAITKILEHRAEYSRAAREAFAALYDVDQYWAPLGEFLTGVGRRPLPRNHSQTRSKR